MTTATTHSLWAYNSTLLDQAIDMLQRLQEVVPDRYDFSKAIGPHLRHIVEHYQALWNALDHATGLVDYDARERDMRLQTQPQTMLTTLRALAERMRGASNSQAHRLSALNFPLQTRLQAGTVGELTVTVPTTLGRELMFVSSHTVHHYALLAHYCRQAGLELGHDFGKAPATVAFERQSA